MEGDMEVRVQGQNEKVYYSQPDSANIRMYYEYTQDHFRKGQDYNLLVKKFARVKGWKQDYNGVLLDIQGDVIHNTQIDSDGELRPVIDTRFGREHFSAFLRIEVYQHGIFRLLAGEGNIEREHHTVMLEGVPPLRHESYTVKEEEDILWIQTKTCRGAVNLADFSFEIYDGNGRKIYRQENNDRVLDFTYESFPFGYVENPEIGEKIAVCTSRMEHDENYFGFGEQYSPVNKKMQEVDVFITDPLSVGSPRTYVALPFYFSTKGYGMYVNTHYRSKFFMGNRSNRSVSCHIYGEDILDIFYIAGREPKEILKAYTDITGKSPMVPRWSFGLWMSRCSYRTQEEVLSVAEELRERDIPCDVMNIDTDWFEVPWACDWKFGRQNFPHPETMIKKLEEMGIKLCLWQKPYITAEYLPKLLEELDKKGWIPHNSQDKIARANPVIDLSNPECVRWYKEQLASLHRMGVKVIKTDMGEGVPAEGNYFGYSGEEIRNIYTYLYSRAAYEAACEAGCEPILWGRSTYAGGQKYPLHWAGDPFTDFDGLRYSIRSGLSMGMSGFTYWSHDIGGFLGRPTEQVYIRWMQAGMFCSHARCHGADNPREPWTFGERAERIFRKYDKLRYRLFPYIYSMAYARSKEGLPIMEHLYLSNPGDRNCLSIEDEWMFGDAFLVAPILSADDSREVYFPEGIWYHCFSGEVCRGGQYRGVKMDLEDMPLYVRAGSLVPMGQDRSYIASKEQEHLTLLVYEMEEGQSHTLYYDGEVHEFTAVFEKNQVRISLGTLKDSVTVCLIGTSGVQKQQAVRGGCIFKRYYSSSEKLSAGIDTIL